MTGAGTASSTQTSDGHDMDHYADDLAAVTAHLDLQGAVHVGHSTGGGEVVRYIARHGENRVAKAVLISSVPPLMLQTEANPSSLQERLRRLPGPGGRQPVRVLPGLRRRVRSMASTGPARSPRKRSSTTGGARE